MTAILGYAASLARDVLTLWMQPQEITSHEIARLGHEGNCLGQVTLSPSSETEMDTNKQISASANLSSRGFRYRMLTFLSVVLALTVLSTHGTLDEFADEHVTETTVESFVIYGVARGLNASVSMFQSAEVSAAVVGVTVGEALDPINDATERLSSLMIWAIGSLLLQDVVLTFVSSTVFKWIFALIAVLTMSTLIVVWRRRSAGAPSNGVLDRFCRTAVRIFVLAAIARFIVPVFVIVSYLAGQALLQPEIDRQSAELSTISEEVLSEDQQNLDQPAINENGLEGQNEQNPATEEQRSFFERARDAASRMLPEISMPDLSILSVLLERAANLAEYLTRLLVLIAVKNIILPLMFLALALKFIRPVTMSLLAMTSAIERDLKDIKGKAKEIGNGGSSALPAP